MPSLAALGPETLRRMIGGPLAFVLERSRRRGFSLRSLKGTTTDPIDIPRVRVSCCTRALGVNTVAANFLENEKASAHLIGSAVSREPP